MKHAWLALPLVALAGCPDRTISSVNPAQGRVEVIDVPATPQDKLDILFVIDDSRSMSEEQDSLEANFAKFIDVLEHIPGGLPNVHIGVVTSDMGTSTTTGVGGNVGGCNGRGKDGALHALPDGTRFLVDENDGNGGRRTNYAGTLATAFAQIADVGTMGCGIEQHLASMKRALDPTNVVNAGFLREDAFLAIVLIADEDDCSQAKLGLFDGTTDGDTINFRCTSDGIACDTPSTPLDQAEGPREDCHPKAAPAWIESIEQYASFVHGLKRDPHKLILGGILGPTDKFAITHNANTTTKVLKESCTYNGPTQTQFAFPAIRIAAFLDDFPQQNTNETICTDDLSGPLLAVSANIASVLGNPCFKGELLDVDPVTEGPQYSCSVIETRRNPDGTDTDIAVLPSCDHDNTRACWSIVADHENCSTESAAELALAIDWHGEPHGGDLRVHANCVTVDDSGSGPVL